MRNRARAQSQGCLAASPKITLGALEGVQGTQTRGAPAVPHVLSGAFQWTSLGLGLRASHQCQVDQWHVSIPSLTLFYALGSYDIRASCPSGSLQGLSGPLLGRGADLVAEMHTPRLQGGPRGSCLWGTQELEYMGQWPQGPTTDRKRDGQAKGWWPGVNSFPHSAMFWGGALRSLRIPAGTWSSWLF